ncbi:hypothetical protein DS421_9g274160 [Arachis hypogaea]|nr:hypothetical protein DS421_9g274160 [Arachis hypogaea]
MERSKKDWMKTVGKQRDGRDKASPYAYLKFSPMNYINDHSLLHTNNLRGIDPYSRKVYYLDDPVHLLEVIDTSGGCGASFVVEIVSEEFEGKRLLERHRMVNAALEEEMKEIHALSVKKAVTPEQWKQLQQDSNQANPAA